jgi:hypothetical protein
MTMARHIIMQRIRASQPLLARPVRVENRARHGVRSRAGRDAEVRRCETVAKFDDGRRRLRAAASPAADVAARPARGDAGSR